MGAKTMGTKDSSVVIIMELLHFQLHLYRRNTKWRSLGDSVLHSKAEQSAFGSGGRALVRR